MADEDEQGCGYSWDHDLDEGETADGIPGPTPDRAAAELTEAELMLAERMLRDLPHGKVISTAELIPLVAAVLAELDRQRETLTGCVAENQRLYAERDDLMVENRRIRGEASRMGNELDRQRLVVRAAEALVECDAAKPGLGQSISVWRRQRRELLDALAAAVRALLEGEGR